MDTKPIKVSEDNYRWLVEVAGDLQKQTGKQASIDDAISFVRGGDILKLAGSWKMTDHEEREMYTDLKRGWKKWEKRLF